MEKLIPTESLLQYYKRIGQEIPQDFLNEPPGTAHFNVRKVTPPTCRTPFNRRDYFKICLSRTMGPGKGTLLYNDQEIKLEQPCIIFTNPTVPTSIETEFGTVTRHAVFFNKQFIDGLLPPEVQYASPLFNAAVHPVVELSVEEHERLSNYFVEMQILRESSYPFRNDMIRSILQLLIHDGIRLQQQRVVKPVVLRDRLVTEFFSMLNLQFPVDSPESSLKLLTPAHFADRLHVHVNHLNSVVKKFSGKSTREIIQERVVAEARALLRNTSWNVAEVAYALGFEHPSHFSKYFKQQTGASPQDFRGQMAGGAAHTELSPQEFRGQMAGVPVQAGGSPKDLQGRLAGLAAHTGPSAQEFRGQMAEVLSPAGDSPEEFQGRLAGVPAQG